MIPDSAHGTNPASVRLAGFEAVHGPVRRARARRRRRAREARATSDVAGLMLTNPNTLGLFEEEIERDHAASSTSVGGLVYYDGANLNAILGRCRPGRHGVRHRPHQHPQDVRDPARRGRARRRARSG